MSQNRFSQRYGNCQILFGVAIAVFMISITEMGFAGQILVPGNYSTIQGAIDAANNGDEIIVSEGTYEENIQFKGKNITLRSTNPTDSGIVDTTIIDGNEIDSVVTFSGNETSDCLLSGFTITNGRTQTYGAGIIGNGSKARIEYNMIFKNSTGSGGLGGGLFSCNGIIRHNTINTNNAQHGGGLHSCHGLIEDNKILHNSAQYYGGGIASSNGIIRNNIIQNNTGRWCGGISHCKGIIQGNTIESNTGVGIRVCYGPIRGNTIRLNNGGGIANSTGPIVNNLIEYNKGGILNCTNSIKDNIIQHNQSDINGGGDLSMHRRYRK